MENRRTDVEASYSTEQVCDETRTCPHCNNSFEVVRMIYGEGTGHVRREGYVDDDPVARKLAKLNAAEDAMNKVASTYIHRCTNCGKYSQQEIQAMVGAFNRFEWDCSQKRIRYGLTVFGAGFLAIAMYSLQLPYLPYIPGLIAAVAAVRFVRLPFLSKKDFNKQINEINSPKRVGEWLANWRKHGTAKINAMRNARKTEKEMEMRRSYWQELFDTQHFNDPIKSLTIFICGEP